MLSQSYQIYEFFSWYCSIYKRQSWFILASLVMHAHLGMDEKKKMREENWLGLLLVVPYVHPQFHIATNIYYFFEELFVRSYNNIRFGNDIDNWRSTFEDTKACVIFIGVMSYRNVVSDSVIYVPVLNVCIFTNICLM